MPGMLTALVQNESNQARRSNLPVPRQKTQESFPKQSGNKSQKKSRPFVFLLAALTKWKLKFSQWSSWCVLSHVVFSRWTSVRGEVLIFLEQ